MPPASTSTSGSLGTVDCCSLPSAPQHCVVVAVAHVALVSPALHDRQPCSPATQVLSAPSAQDFCPTLEHSLMHSPQLCAFAQKPDEQGQKSVQARQV